MLVCVCVCVCVCGHGQEICDLVYQNISRNTGALARDHYAVDLQQQLSPGQACMLSAVQKCTFHDHKSQLHNELGMARTSRSRRAAGRDVGHQQPARLPLAA